MGSIKKKTPSDASDFEREQLRFFLSNRDVTGTLAEMNPSLAWLPELPKMKLIEHPRQLTMWIERNFADSEAIREVAANVEYFDEELADLLENRLSQRRSSLPSLLTKCWQLIIRHIRNSRRGMLRSDWFELQSRLKAGDYSKDALKLVADVLRPKLKIGKLISWDRNNDLDAVPKRPSDLMSIDYEIEAGVTEREVLAAWPKDAPSDLDCRLLDLLSDALNSALEDAIDAEVETNAGYGISDIDVPSVATHKQNEYRSGFLPIVRTIAEIWRGLAKKNISLALPFVERWSSSELKLNKRLALYAATDKTVPVDVAAKILVELPQHLFFHTNATVEVFRLMTTRWAELPSKSRAMIEEKISAGPSRNDFRADVDPDRMATAADRARYDILGQMQRFELELSDTSKALIGSIQSRHPEWELRPSEQAGFHIWHGDASWGAGDTKRFRDLSDEVLVDEADKRADDDKWFLDRHGDWQAFCQTDPSRALRGLDAKARSNEWPAWAWNPFLWAAQKLDDPEAINLAAELLLKFPEEVFQEVASTASWWLDQKAKALDENRLWALWDKIEAATVRTTGQDNA